MIGPRADITARLLAAESQLAMCRLGIRDGHRLKPRFTSSFRILWVVLSRLWEPWRTAIHLVQPATVKKWHKTAFRIYWRWKSRPGRPPIEKDMRDLIRRLSKENPIWTAERIRDTLLLLGFDPPSGDTIRKYMSGPTNSKDRSTTWLPFLRNHLDVSWAMDFLVVVTARPHQGLGGGTPVGHDEP